MVASSKKIAGLKANLIKSGIDTSALDRIHSPAGLEIGAVSPAEIALSILAELVAVRRAGSKQGASREHEPVGQALESANDTTDEGCCSGQG